MPPAWLGIAGGNPDLLTAEGGEGEGLKGGPCSQALTLARCACLSLSRKR